MAKLRIDIDEIDVEKTIDKIAEIAKAEAPHIKNGLKSVETDVVKAVKGIYNWLADNEELQKDE